MTRRLHALRVGNFKAFADTQRIPLKPITLIFGPNSAGKSSFIHSLALAHEAQFGRDKQGRARLDVHHTDVGGSAIDLGGFRQYVHRGQANKRVEWGALLNVSTLKDDSRFRQLAQLLSPVKVVSLNMELGIELDKYDKPVPGAAPRVESVEVLADDSELLRMSRRDKSGATLRLDRVASSHAVFREWLKAIVETQTTSPEVRPEDHAAADQAIAELLPELVVHAEQFFPSGVERSRTETGEASAARDLFPVSQGNRSEDIAQTVRFLLPRCLNDLVKGISEVLANELHGLQYLGPLRTVPPRHVVFQQHQDENWVSGGNFAWDALSRDEDLREKVNQWLGGHPGVSGTDATLAEMEAAGDVMEEGLNSPRQWMKTPYRLEVAKFYSATDLRDPLIMAFLDRPLSLLERRQLLTKELAEVTSALQQQYESNQARIDREIAVLAPWIEQIQSAKSNEEKERLIGEALNAFRDAGAGSESLEEFEIERRIEQLPYEEAMYKARELVESLEEGGVSHIPELHLWDIDKRTAVSLRDVGVGISQVLPVLALAYGCNRKLVAIEQPEIHLHPALQAELADVFIESALGERQNTFILETHSEHLILRLMRRIREGIISPDNVCVVFVEPLKRGSRFIELRIDEEGDFIDEWPGGFFEESFHEKFAGR